MEKTLRPLATRTFYHPGLGKLRSFMTDSGDVWFSLKDVLVALGRNIPRPCDTAKTIPQEYTCVIRPLCIGLSELFDGMMRRQRRTVISLDGVIVLASKERALNGPYLLDFLIEYVIPVFVALREDLERAMSEVGMAPTKHMVSADFESVAAPSLADFTA